MPWWGLLMLDLLDMFDDFEDYEDFVDNMNSSSEDEEEESSEQAEMVLEASKDDLWGACRNGDFGVVKRLITNENINSIFKSNLETPLIAACRGNRLKVVQLLIKAGADVLKHGEYPRGNYYPLHTACNWASPAVVSYLLDHGAKEHVNVSANGKLPLHETYWNRRDSYGIVIMELLIKAGAKVDVKGSDGNTLLLKALGAVGFRDVKSPIQTHVKKIGALLEAGADPNVFHMNGDHPLILSKRYPNVFRLLVEHGANVNIIGPGNEPLYNNDSIGLRCVEILLEHNAGVDISCGHESCQCDLLSCCYVSHRDANNRNSAKLFEAHSIKMDVAGLYFGKGACCILRSGKELLYYKGKRLDQFRNKCKAQLDKMSTAKIFNTDATYLDVLYQRRWALTRVGHLDLKTCQAASSIYGGLIRSRFVTGLMKLSFMDQCMGFFELTELPHLPTLCVVEILGYLSAADLKSVDTIVAAHETQRENEDGTSNPTEPKPEQSGDASTSKGVESKTTADGGNSITGAKRKLSGDDECTSGESKRSKVSLEMGSASSRSIPGLSADVESALSEPKPGPSHG